MTGILYRPGENLSWRNPLTRSQRSTPAQREQAQKRFTTIRPALEKSCHSGPGGTYPEHPGVHCAVQDEALPGQRSSWSGGCKDSFRQREITPFVPADAITLVEGLALQTPQRSMAAIHRKARCHCSRKKYFSMQKEGQKIYYNEICILL
jgi:hypothetical protein